MYTADVPYNAGVSGAMTTGGSAARSASFALPDGPAGVGTFSVAVTVDYYNTIAEYYPGNVGETNNTTTASFASSLNVYPDLQVVNLAVTPGVVGVRADDYRGVERCQHRQRGGEWELE